ncbi:MAG: flagellar protein FlaG [Gammaproteobacteria bacterium]
MPTEITTQARIAASNAGNSQGVVIVPNRAVTRQDIPQSGKDLPPAKESSLPPKESLDNASNEMTQYAQSLQRDLYFSVDQESGETVIKVVESESQRLVRTIPSEEFLHASREFNGSVGNLLRAKA